MTKIKSRVNYSIINAIIAVITNVVTIIMTFIMQTVLIKLMGSEYNGLNGLFTNIISMLSMVELGIGPAIIFNLYKPIKDNNITKIKSLMNFYKKCYHVIGGVILLLGIIVLPFLDIIVGENSLTINIYIVFMLFIFEAFSSYMISYKRSILYANQENYITNIIHIICIIGMNVLQVILILTTQNYYFVVAIRILFKILENVIITIIANRKYSYIKGKDAEKINKEILVDIKQKVKGSIFHKVGGNVISGTDNIVISSFLGIDLLGKYVNYNMIIQSISNLIAQAFSAITASVGNLLLDKQKDKAYEIYKNINFICFWIYTYVGISIYCVIEPFVKLWIGNEYLLTKDVLLVLVLNFFLQGMRQTITTFKSAAGIYYEDRYVPIMEATINIVMSIILTKILGLVGVFLGTIISVIFVHLYSYPKFVYYPIFGKKKLNYITELLRYTLEFIVIWIITAIIVKIIVIENTFLQLLTNIGITFLIPNIIILMKYGKKNEFEYFKKLLINKIQGRKERNG